MPRARRYSSSVASACPRRSNDCPFGGADAAPHRHFHTGAINPTSSFFTLLHFAVLKPVLRGRPPQPDPERLTPLFGAPRVGSDHSLRALKWPRRATQFDPSRPLSLRAGNGSSCPKLPYDANDRGSTSSNQNGRSTTLVAAPKRNLRFASLGVVSRGFC